MNKYFFILLSVFLVSCSDSNWNGEWGATVGDCDEVCTVYYSVQKELMSKEDLLDLNFPSKIERRKHVLRTEKGHKVDSWFKKVDGTDTIKREFSCKVVFDTQKIKYVIEDLEIKSSDTIYSLRHTLERDTVIIELEYYGWGCPCPQWITQKNKEIYESKGIQEGKSLDLFWNIKPANDSLPSPFDLTANMKQLKFKFMGQFL